MDHLQADGVLKLEVDSPILFPNLNNIAASKYQHHLRKALLVILSVSLLSFLLSLFTSISFLHYCYTYYFSTFLLPLFTQTFERKYMFLLCNGILIFLARKSGLHGSHDFPSGLEMEDDTSVHGKMMKNVVEEHLILQPAEPVDCPSEVAAETSMQGEVLEIQAEEKAAAQDSVLISEADRQPAEDVEIDNEQECGLLVGGEDDGESEGSASNTEELNKKIEEFIRKMKEELKLQTQQQQLIAA